MLLGDFPNSIAKFNQFYSYSSDILQLLSDLMEVTHKTTSAKLIKGYKLEGYSKFQQDKITEISEKITISSLARIWQMLMKGNLEISLSNSPKMAFEMLLARICHLVALPNLQNILLDLPSNLSDSKNHQEIKIVPPMQNFVAQKTNESKNNDTNDEVVNEILRNFEGAKIV